MEKNGIKNIDGLYKIEEQNNVNDITHIKVELKILDTQEIHHLKLQMKNQVS